MQQPCGSKSLILMLRRRTLLLLLPLSILHRQLIFLVSYLNVILAKARHSLLQDTEKLHWQLVHISLHDIKLLFSPETIIDFPALFAALILRCHLHVLVRALHLRIVVLQLLVDR